MSGRALPEANDDGQDAGFVQLLGEEDGSEDENPRLGPENPGGKGRCGQGDGAAAEATNDFERDSPS